MSYSSRAAQLMRRGGHSRPLDYFLLHPLPDSSALTLQAAARVPFPFLGWALLLPVSEPLHTLLLGSAGHPVKAVTLNSCRSQLKYLPRKPPLTFTDIAPFPVRIFYGYGTHHPKSQRVQKQHAHIALYSHGYGCSQGSTRRFSLGVFHVTVISRLGPEPSLKASLFVSGGWGWLSGESPAGPKHLPAVPPCG